LAIDSASPATVRGLEVAGDWTMVFLAGAGMAAGVAAIVFLLLPRQKDRLVVSTAARYAEAMGGTRTAKMEA